MAAQNTFHNFNLASPYAAEQREIERREQMAQMLQQQSVAPFEKFGYNGIEAPIPVTAGLAKMLQAYIGGKMAREGINEQKTLGERYKTETMDTLRQAQTMREGTPGAPERPAMLDPQELEQAADQKTTGAYQIPEVKAIAPNIQGSSNLLLGSNNPMLMQMGLSERQEAIKSQRMAAALQQAGYGTPAATGPQAIAMNQAAGGAPGPTNAAAARMGQTNAGSGVNPRTIALLLGGNDPNAMTELGKMEQAAFAKKNEPIVSRENAPLLQFNQATGKYDVAFSPSPKLGEGMQYNFETNQVSTAPGYENALQAQQRNTANIAAESTIVEVPFNDGTSQKMTLARARELYPQVYGTKSMVQNGSLRGQAATPIAAQAAVGQNSAIGRDASVTVAPVNKQLGSNPAYVAGEIERAKLTTKREIERSDQFHTTYRDATSMLNNLELLSALSSDPNVASGTLANDISSIKGMAASLGIATPAGLPAEEAIKAITVEMALKAKNQGGTNLMPGAMAVFEQKMLQSMTPQLAQSKEGRTLMIGVFKVKAERDRLIAEMAGDYEDKHGKLDGKFDKQLRAFSKANPMFTLETSNALIELSKRLSTGAR